MVKQTCSSIQLSRKCLNLFSSVYVRYVLNVVPLWEF